MPSILLTCYRNKTSTIVLFTAKQQFGPPTCNAFFYPALCLKIDALVKPGILPFQHNSSRSGPSKHDFGAYNATARFNLSPMGSSCSLAVEWLMTYDWRFKSHWVKGFFLLYPISSLSFIQVRQEGATLLIFLYILLAMQLWRIKLKTRGLSKISPQASLFVWQR